MPLLIPDDVLEQLTCDSCFKYLSVKPVKIYPNRKTRCGRCAQKDDGGVVSIIGLLAEKTLFKCVNRYDGCRELLTYEQVAEHEKTCSAERYDCPLCDGTNWIPSYLLLKHVEREHSGSMLKNPSFVIEFQGADASNAFFHKINDDLFCVEYEMHFAEDYLLLGVRQVSKSARISTKQNFTLTYGKTVISMTSNKPCGSLSSQERDRFCFRIENINNFPFVNVEVDIAVPPEIINLPETISLLPKQNVVDHPTNGKAIVVSILNDNPSKKWRPRKLFLSENFQKSHPGLTVNVNGNGLRFLEKELDVFLHCLKCQRISQSEEDYYRGIFYKDQNYHYICYYCHQMNMSLDASGVTKDSSLLDYYIFKKIRYFCFWNCGNSFDSCSIIDHEFTCFQQPERECPMKNCEHKASLRKLEQHFQEKHKQCFINGRKYSFTFLANSLFSVKDNYHTSRFKKVFSNYYSWVVDTFILVQMLWNNEVEKYFEANVSVCGKQDGTVFPRALMVYDGDIKVFSERARIYPKKTVSQIKTKTLKRKPSFSLKTNSIQK